MLKNSSTILPSINLSDGQGTGISISPAIGFGTSGFSLGATIQIDVQIGNIYFGANVGFSNFENNFEQNGAVKLKGSEFRRSFALGYNDINGKNSIILAQNIFDNSGDAETQKMSQKTGMITLKGAGTFFSYENDGEPFNRLGITSKNPISDSYRTTGARLGYEDTYLELRLFTGFRDMTHGIYGEAMDGQDNARAPHGFVKSENCEINEYRAGILSISIKGYKYGLNNDENRYFFQNEFAHTLIKPQAWIPFIPNINGGGLFMEYKTLNPFTTW